MRVVLQLEQGTVAFVQRQQINLAGFGVDDHGTEFEQCEQLASLLTRESDGRSPAHRPGA